jgi:hypothetical protein
MITGAMQEAKGQQASLEDVDEDTFTRFGEFLYGGNYNVTKPTVVDQPRSEGGDSKSASQQLPSKRKKQDNRTRAQERFLGFANLQLPTVDKDSFPVIESSGVEKNTSKMYDYSQAFCHVHLYTFAEKYQINSLKNLILCNLHKVLRDTKFHPSRIGDLCDMIRYVYQNTPELISQEEPLRSMLVHYVACNFERLVLTEEFQELIIAGGPIIKALCQKVGQRILSMDDNNIVLSD